LYGAAGVVWSRRRADGEDVRHRPVLAFPSGRAVIIENVCYLAPDLMANDPTRI
jgi:hypothetical protein